MAFIQENRKAGNSVFSIILLLFVVALCSCSIEKHMDRKTNELVKELEATPQWESLSEEVIPWDTAVHMALTQNTDILKGQLSIDDAERSVQRIFLDMIPGVNLDAMITEDINNLSGISANDVSYHANIVFNFPSLTQVPIQYYTAQASVYRAKRAMDLKKREIISKLYKCSKEHIIAYDQYKLNLTSISHNDNGTEKRKIEEEWEQTRKKISSELSIAMGNIQKPWIVDPNTLPKINWSKYKTSSKKLDKLILTMMAMELEASRLNLLGIKMQYFPELNINFYSPSLFASTAGTQGGVYADSSDMKINVNLSWRLDTQLRVWHQLKAGKEYHNLLVKEIHMRMVDRREQVKMLIKSRADFEEWERFIQKKADFLASKTPVNADDYKRNRKDMQDTIRELLSQRQKNVEVEASLIIEYGLL